VPERAGAGWVRIVRQRLTLILDGDDTLWENNVYFERAIEEFIDFLDHSSLSRAEVRAALDEIERANVASHGYGARSFARSLRDLFERLGERQRHEAELATVVELGERILRQPIELIDGVEETLAFLRERHRLLLLTKGHAEEQRLKLDRSGLEPYFERTVIVAEKDVSTYRDLVAELGLVPSRTWMVGNSPRSDINPALAAGLNAVFVPHEQTWRLEQQEISDVHGRLLIVERFRDLRRHFG
jgi:putative hydrolase of the HAD superfamily